MTHRVQQGDGHDQTVVALEDGIHEEPSDAGDGEYSLHDEGARHQGRQQRSQDGDDRDERVAQHMDDNDSPFLEPLALRGPDIVLPCHFQH